MIRAFKLEWLKIRNYKVFWILLVMYILALFIITSLGMVFFEFLKSKGADFQGIDPTILPIYDFPDIWQNTTYLGSFAKVLLAFIVIISVNNDTTYNTMRQNIIDGISKREFLLSKLSLILFLATISTSCLFVFDMVNGSIHSHPLGLAHRFDELEFLAVYFYDIVIYCSLAFLLALLIKKSGFVIIFLALYSLLFEPIAGAIFTYDPHFQGTILRAMTPFFPIYSLSDMIPVPFPKYYFQEIADNPPWSAVLISTGWLVVYLSAIYWILTKRDLK